MFCHGRRCAVDTLIFGSEALEVLEILENAGFKAYFVGGCVRDALAGRTIGDIDIATSAKPDDTKRLFSSSRVIETGIEHGTVTVIFKGCSFEITTFRQDGDYLDLRHPESVIFYESVEEDLARRDFTVNSMAADRKGAIIDIFGGWQDLEKRLIRCTGDPDRRFKEDALRIMRALRFSSVLGFGIEESTARSIHKNKDLLLEISVERIFSELKKLLVGDNVFSVLIEFSDVICTVIPELAPSVGFDHMSKYHSYDVYTHIAKTVEASEPCEILRLTMLLHDVGKPYVCTFDGKYRHFKGHPEVSEKMAHDILRRFRAKNDCVRLVSLLCRLHDRQIEVSERAVKRLLSKITFSEARLLCKVRIADASAHAKSAHDRGDEALEILSIIDKLEAHGATLHVKDLEVDGRDMIALGFEGKGIGEILSSLLDEVIDGTLPNEKEALIARAKEKTV